jgi:hypothetical protein
LFPSWRVKITHLLVIDYDSLQKLINEKEAVKMLRADEMED